MLEIIIIFLCPQQQEQDPTNLYISNLPLSMDEQELEGILKSFGQVVSTRILRDSNGASRGVGFARWGFLGVLVSDLRSTHSDLMLTSFILFISSSNSLICTFMFYYIILSSAVQCDMYVAHDSKKPVCATSKFKSEARVRYSLVGALDRAACLWEVRLSLWVN